MKAKIDKTSVQVKLLGKAKSKNGFVLIRLKSGKFAWISAKEILSNLAKNILAYNENKRLKRI
jgi:uncharacterized protein YgiM (DUF1202 family)